MKNFQSDRPELQPSYLQSHEIRKSITINNQRIVLNFDRRQNYNAKHIDVVDNKSIFILCIEHIKDLSKIEQLCETFVTKYGNIQQCIMFSQSRKLFNTEKINLFAKHWNIPYLNTNKYSMQDIVTFCIKHYWFSTVCYSSSSA